MWLVAAVLANPPSAREGPSVPIRKGPPLRMEETLNLSDSESSPKPVDEMLATIIQNYQVSSRLQQQVLENIRRLADNAFAASEGSEVKLTAGESMILTVLSQQLDVIHSQMTQLEQVNLAILKHVLEQHQGN